MIDTVRPLYLRPYVLALSICACREGVSSARASVEPARIAPVDPAAWYSAGALTKEGRLWLLPSRGDPLFAPFDDSLGYGDAPFAMGGVSVVPSNVAFVGGYPAVYLASNQDVVFYDGKSWAKTPGGKGTTIVLATTPLTTVSRDFTTGALTYRIRGDSVDVPLGPAWSAIKSPPRAPIVFAPGPDGSLAVVSAGDLSVAFGNVREVLWERRIDESAAERLTRSDVRLDLREAIEFGKAIGQSSQRAERQFEELADSLSRRAMPRLRNGGVAVGPDSTVWVLLRSSDPRESILYGLKDGRSPIRMSVSADAKRLVAVGRQALYILAGERGKAPAQLIEYPLVKVAP